MQFEIPIYIVHQNLQRYWTFLILYCWATLICEILSQNDKSGFLNMGAPKCTFFGSPHSLSNTQVPAYLPGTKNKPGNIFFLNILSFFVKCPGMTKYKISFGVTICIGVLTIDLFIIKIGVISQVVKFIQYFLQVLLKT